MNYDAIVIGAGAMGSAAAYHLARSGQKVLLVEQFQVDHKLGSSYGYTRIIRYAYQDPAYIEMAKVVYPMWHALEQEAEEILYIKTGGLDFARADNPHFLATRDAMQHSGIVFEMLSPAEVHARFPQFHLEADMQAIYQADAGALRVSRCIIAQIRLAVEKYGATLLENTAVQKITPSVGGVTVETSQGTFSAARLVISAGGWSKPLLDSLGMVLPLEVMRQPVTFFAPPPNFTVETMPIFIAWGEPNFYGIGGIDGTGFKCAQHLGGEIVNPDTMNRTVEDSFVAHIRRFLHRHIPTMAEQPLVETHVCMYTMTPDEDFVIDQHPQYPHIACAAGFSGHGFKFSTLVGKMLGDLVCSQPISFDLNLFKASRFTS